MLKGHLSRAMHHQVYWYTKKDGPFHVGAVSTEHQDLHLKCWFMTVRGPPLLITEFVEEGSPFCPPVLLPGL